MRGSRGEAEPANAGVFLAGAASNWGHPYPHLFQETRKTTSGSGSGAARRGFNEAAVEDRGKLSTGTTSTLSKPCFNEAAVEDRGKRLGDANRQSGRPDASMRPRSKTAGKRRPVAVDAVRQGAASMRPRSKTAENVHAGQPSVGAFRVNASMRPRSKTAENVYQRLKVHLRQAAASMRPRSKTAENHTSLVYLRHQAASGFNEAAVEDRGKLGNRAWEWLWGRCFNEAAVEDRGKPDAPNSNHRAQVTVASMRPRSKTAENQAQNDRLSVTAADGFNEAAVEDRGKRSGSTATRWSRSLQ